GLLAAHTFWMLGQRYAQASKALAAASADLLAGRATERPWVAADDTGDLARTLAEALNRARQRTERLAAAAARLREASERLASISDRQQQLLSEQAATLAQTREAAAEV